MLSGTADSIYWLARYVERAEYLARILETTQRLTALPLAYTGSTNEWASAVATAGCTASFTKANLNVDPATMQAIINNPAGYYFNIHTALNPGGVARGQLTRVQ